jgi:hypothetical protein
MATTSGVGDLDLYRDEADRFIAALDEEFYLHFAGHKETYELGPIYERFSDLTSLEACRGLGEAAAASGDGVNELWRFACEGYLGDLTRAEAEEVALLEATLQTEVDGETIGYRMLRPTIANEPDRGRRERLELARNELGEARLLPSYRTAAEKRRDGTKSLGSETYRQLYDRFGFELDALASQCRELLAQTEDLYVDTLDPLLRARIGVGLDEAARWDMPRLFRATNWDSGFPGDAMLPALEGTLADLGIDLRRQQNVHLDLEVRPNKSPRAFCAPIEVPGRVMLVIQPIGGPDDWHALFHEAGHTEHFAHTASGLPVEARRLGDNAVTEGWAALFEHLVDDPVWLNRRLDFGRPEEFVAEAGAKLLFIVRRYCAKLLYELELHGDRELDEMRPRYVELLREATKIEPAASDYLADVDPGFYASSYLRSWAFESQLRSHLLERFGSAWFSRRDAGSLLRELWYEGQSMTAEQMLLEVTGRELVLAAVGERIGEAVG